MPDLSPLDASLAATYTERSRGIAVEGRMFVGRGTAATNATFVRRVGATAVGIYQAIVNAVDRIKGSSIRWMLMIDSKLR